MICFEDNFALLWLYCLKLLLQFFRNYYRLFFLSCPTTKISSFDFTSPFVSWGFPYRGTNFNFLGHNIWIVFNNSAPWRFQFFIKFQNISVMLSYVRKCFIYSFLKTTNFFTKRGILLWMQLKCLFSVTLIAFILVWTALRLYEFATEFSDKILFSEGTFTDW